MAYRGQGRDCQFVWSIAHLGAVEGNWAYGVSSGNIANEVPWEIESVTPRHDYGNRQTNSIQQATWPNVKKRVKTLETHGFDASGPVTEMSWIYPVACFCNRQGEGTFGTVTGTATVYSCHFRPNTTRGSTVSSATWPSCIEARLLYDAGTTDHYAPGLVESLEFRFDEDAELQMSVGVYFGTCKEGTVYSNSVAFDKDVNCPFTAAMGTVRYNGTVTAIKNGNIAVTRTLIPHRSLADGTLLGNCSLSNISGRGALNIYLETQADWDAIEQDCRNGNTLATLTMHYVGSTRAGHPSAMNLIGTFLIDPTDVVKPVGGGELMRTVNFNLLGPNHSATPTVPFDIQGTFSWRDMGANWTPDALPCRNQA